MNLAGVEIVLNMRRKMEQMQAEINEFVAHVRQELQQGEPGREEEQRAGPREAAPAPIVKAASARARPSPWPRRRDDG